MRIEDIHKRIQELMEERGWSKYKLANECNMNTSTVYSMLEDTEKAPSLSTIQMICDGCGITLGEFFKDEVSYVELFEEDKRLISYYHLVDEKAKLRILTYAEGIVDEYRKA